MVGITPGEELETTVRRREQRQEGYHPIPPDSDLQTGFFLGGNLKGTSRWNYLGWSHLPCSLGFTTAAAAILWKPVPPACLS